MGLQYRIGGHLEGGEPRLRGFTGDRALAPAGSVHIIDQDHEAVKTLVTVAKRDPGQWDHTVSRYREDRKSVAARQPAVQRLVDAGLTVIDPPNRGGGPVRLDNLADSDGNEIDDAAHAACPGHVVALSKWDLDDVAYYFTDPVGNGHKDRWATHGSTITAPTVVNGKMTEEAKAARRNIIERNKAWRAAEPVRREWIRDLLARKTPPKGLVAVEMSQRHECLTIHDISQTPSPRPEAYEAETSEPPEDLLHRRDPMTRIRATVLQDEDTRSSVSPR